ncbi:hypothetical protein BDN72DRAFT_963255 [Pluteus cervinus]|uniref:Uncharacterized protein n=1 Tax=Pluteus cervinus TaxID=181527 RepID=A0ACD3AF97_9AGAR|nr:hypothetical protein BDN72DRAFT_963255 [Pluteus cervinus]
MWVCPAFDYSSTASSLHHLPICLLLLLKGLIASRSPTSVPRPCPRQLHPRQSLALLSRCCPGISVSNPSGQLLPRSRRFCTLPHRSGTSFLLIPQSITGRDISSTNMRINTYIPAPCSKAISWQEMTVSSGMSYTAPTSSLSKSLRTLEATNVLLGLKNPGSIPQVMRLSSHLSIYPLLSSRPRQTRLPGSFRSHPHPSRPVVKYVL